MEGYKIQYQRGEEWEDNNSTPYAYYKTLDHMIASILGHDTWQASQRIIDDNGVVIANSIGIEQRYNTYSPNLLEELRGDLLIEPDRFRQLCLEWLSEDRGQ